MRRSLRNSNLFLRRGDTFLQRMSFEVDHLLDRCCEMKIWVNGLKDGSCHGFLMLDWIYHAVRLPPEFIKCAGEPTIEKATTDRNQTGKDYAEFDRAFRGERADGEVDNGGMRCGSGGGVSCLIPVCDVFCFLIRCIWRFAVVKNAFLYYFGYLQKKYGNYQHY